MPKDGRDGLVAEEEAASEASEWEIRERKEEARLGGRSTRRTVCFPFLVCVLGGGAFSYLFSYFGQL